MENPSEWYSRKHMRFIGVLLTVIGIGLAIVFFPTAPILSLLLFALIGGPGLLISYKLRRIRSTLLWGLGVAACVYCYVTAIPILGCARGLAVGAHPPTNYYTKTDITLFGNSLITVVPIAVLVTLAIAWLGRNKVGTLAIVWLGRDSKTFSAFKKLAPITLLIATPFIIAGLSDYNYRGDPNPPQVINLRIVDKWIDQHYSTSDWPEYYDVFIVKGETLDGSFWFSFLVSTHFYNEHDIGSYCWIRVRSGALGYACISMLDYGD